MDKKKCTSIGGAISAVLASVCCIGPVILAWLGLGSAGIAFVRGFGRFHIFFMILTFILLGTAFYFSYIKECKFKDQTAGSCQVNNKQDRIILWAATAIAVVFLILPFLI